MSQWAVTLKKLLFVYPHKSAVKQTKLATAKYIFMFSLNSLNLFVINFFRDVTQNTSTLESISFRRLMKWILYSVIVMPRWQPRDGRHDPMSRWRHALTSALQRHPRRQAGEAPGQHLPTGNDLPRQPGTICHINPVRHAAPTCPDCPRQPIPAGRTVPKWLGTPAAKQPIFTHTLPNI
jgi:hypothetical protein